MPFPAKTTPDAILEIAHEMLDENDSDTFSMRALAERLGIKAPSLYRHYADRAALETALVARGSTQLRDRLEAMGASAPEAALLDAATAYVEFARDNPALYELMMRPQASSGAPKELWNTVLRLTSAVSGRDDDTPAAVALWSFLHGYVSLQRGGAFGTSGPRGAFEKGIQALITGFKPPST
ncbi:MAG: TetR/AcrR family transcriptional regulator [Pleurocapsa sp. SU_196_0]|nr:TetR/AcrR family transcriptional regulator [Pleurocapsa sp. SU_196_0]